MGYGVIARMFHWITVLIVFVMIPVGLTMTQDIPRRFQDPLFMLHKGLGVVFLVLILARIVWRIGHPPPALPAHIPKLQRRAAEGTHLALYGMLLIMAVSGYVRVTAGGFPIEWLDALGVPPLLPKMERVAEIASAVHATAKTLLIALIALHVAAACWHGLIRRDGVFGRMWPPSGRRAER